MKPTRVETDSFGRLEVPDHKFGVLNPKISKKLCYRTRDATLPFNYGNDSYKASCS